MHNPSLQGSRASFRQGWAAVFVLAAALTGCTPVLDWREWRPEGSGLQLLLPCKPVPQVREVVLAGQPVRLALHACSAGGQTWGLAFADVGDPRRIASALQALVSGPADNLGAGPVQAVPTPGVPGATPNPGTQRVLLRGTRPDGRQVQAEVLVFTRGTVVYQATVLGQQLPADAVSTFFESMRLGS
jgi:hypothetical protein